METESPRGNDRAPLGTIGYKFMCTLKKVHRIITFDRRPRCWYDWGHLPVEFNFTVTPTVNGNTWTEQYGLCLIHTDWIITSAVDNDFPFTDPEPTKVFEDNFKKNLSYLFEVEPENLEDELEARRKKFEADVELRKIIEENDELER